MSYCYCSPNRSLRSAFAPGMEVPTYEGQYLYRPETLCMGTKGMWVARTRRLASIRGWETRRENVARKLREAAEAEAATLTPFVIEGTGVTPVETITTTEREVVVAR